MFNVIAVLCIVYTAFDIAVSIYVVRKNPEIRARLLALLAR